MLQNSAKELLNQLNHIIDQCNEQDFSKPLKELSGSTLGQHVRHTLEFFICLFDARNEKLINYDHRQHDPHIESDRRLAQSVIVSINDFLDKSTEDFEVFFEANYTEAEGNNQSMKSSFFRELAYNIEHSIHHMALIKIAINHSLNYIVLPEHFGVASSTVRYRSGQQA
ncbi:MAG: hypothetical protein AAGD05_15925 [Bacteroidota bacterium]